MDMERMQKHGEKASKRMEKGMKKLAIALSDAVSEADSNNSQVVSKDLHKKRLEAEFEEFFITLLKRMENGIHQVIKSYAELCQTNPEFEKKYAKIVFTDLEKLVRTTKVVSQPKNKDVLENSLKEFFLHDKTLQEVYQISDETIEAFYQAAKSLFEQQQYMDASDAFSFLITLNPKRYAFWLCLGHAEYFCAQYEAALMAYAFSVHINPLDPGPHLCASRCYEHLRQMPLAINSLDLALIVIKAVKEFHKMEKEVQNRKVQLQEIQAKEGK